MKHAEFHHSWLVSILIALSCCLCSDRADAKEWSRALQFHSDTRTDRTYGFDLVILDQDEFILLGTCLYENFGWEDLQRKPVVIEGVEDASGSFWPNAGLEVKNEVTGKWDKIADNDVSGRRTRIIIEPNTHHAGLYVRLDPFKPFIGKSELARIVLPTGETAHFQLKHLLPP